MLGTYAHADTLRAGATIGDVSARGWLLFVVMCVIWGVPYLFIKVAVDELSISTMVLARTALAAGLLLPVALYRGQVGAVLRRWRPLLAFAGVEIVVPWFFLGFAEQRISSSLTGLLIAMVPLLAALLALAGPEHEELGGRRVLGLAVGFIGVGALVGFEVGGGDLSAVLALVVVALGYAIGPIVLARWLADLPSLGVIAVALTASALVYLPLGLAQAPSALPSPRVVAAVVSLAVLCTALAFLLFFALIAEVGAARAVVITYVNPAVALLLGVLLLNERLTFATGVGFALVLVGCALATSRTKASSPDAVPLSRLAERHGRVGA